ncbi:MAG: zinc-dependent alcohol dehydrogenase [Gammaproteobacteria bacterium]
MTETNTVLTIPAPGEVRLAEKPYPRIVPGFVLVRVAIAPICIEHRIYKEHSFEWHEDAEHLGHEGVGEIVQVTDGSAFAVGDRVVMYQGNPCGECFVCNEALSPTHCMGIPYEEIDDGGNPHKHIDSLGGREAMAAPGGLLSIEIECGSESGGFGFSTYRIVPESMLQRLPDALPYRYAATANCSAGCTYSGVEDLNVQSGDVVMVAGIGFIGFGAIINAKYRGATVIALGRNDFRMELARKIGADYILDPDDKDWLDKVHGITGNKRGVDAVFECSGYPYYQTRAISALRRYGGMFCFGFLPGSDEKLPIHVLDDIMNKHITITGGHDVAVKHREGLLNMLCDADVQRGLDHMITHEFNMSDGARAFEACLSKKAGKVFLYPQEDCPV